jgi:hypothetical protein
VDESRLVVGVALPFGAWSGNGDPPFTVRAVRRWCALGLGLPMKLEHRALLLPGLVARDVGSWRRFVTLETELGGLPPGLLALGEVDEGRGGDALLRELARDPGAWALSVRAFVALEPGGAAVSEALFSEISLTRKPAHDAARLLALGPEALELWGLVAAA